MREINAMASDPDSDHVANQNEVESAAEQFLDLLCA
jgi:hypothetical protein